MEDKRVRILIVDDDETVLIALEHLLEDEGYSTVNGLEWTGCSGASARNGIRPAHG